MVNCNKESHPTLTHANIIALSTILYQQQLLKNESNWQRSSIYPQSLYITGSSIINAGTRLGETSKSKSHWPIEMTFDIYNCMNNSLILDGRGRSQPQMSSVLVKKHVNRILNHVINIHYLKYLSYIQKTELVALSWSFLMNTTCLDLNNIR